MSNERKYLTANQVRARFGGISDMSLWRWLNDPKLGFPQPTYINKRRFFDEAAIAAWEAEQTIRGAA